MTTVLILLCSVAAGVLLGLGMGGGTLLIPVLLLVGVALPGAQTSALIGFLPAAGLAIYLAARQGMIIWPRVWPTLPFTIAGAFLGAWLCERLDPLWIRRCLGVLLVVMAAGCARRVFAKRR